MSKDLKEVVRVLLWAFIALMFFVYIVLPVWESYP